MPTYREYRSYGHGRFIAASLAFSAAYPRLSWVVQFGTAIVAGALLGWWLP